MINEVLGFEQRAWEVAYLRALAVATPADAESFANDAVKRFRSACRMFQKDKEARKLWFSKQHNSEAVDPCGWDR